MNHTIRPAVYWAIPWAQGLPSAWNMAARITFAGLAGWALVQAGFTQKPQASQGAVFDATSVKPSGSTEIRRQGSGSGTTSFRSFRYLPDRVTCDMPLDSFLREAYSIKDWQISGPDWLFSEKYELTGIMPVGTSREVARLMLQNMLAERFGLRVHWERRGIAAYALVIAPGGPKLQAVEATGKSFSDSTAGRYSGTGLRLDQLRIKLAGLVDRPVVDLTGLTGAYKIDLQWTPDFEETTKGRRDIGLLGLLEPQLGLKLEKRTISGDVLVIDHILRTPTPN